MLKKYTILFLLLCLAQAASALGNSCLYNHRITLKINNTDAVEYNPSSENHINLEGINQNSFILHGTPECKVGVVNLGIYTVPSTFPYFVGCYIHLWDGPYMRKPEVIVAYCEGGINFETLRQEGDNAYSLNLAIVQKNPSV